MKGKSQIDCTAPAGFGTDDKRVIPFAPPPARRPATPPRSMDELIRAQMGIQWPVAWDPAEAAGNPGEEE